MNQPHSSGLDAPLVHRVEPSADAAQIATAVAEVWEDISLVLTPIIGQRGVVALYKRSLFLTAGRHPWLAGMYEQVHATVDLLALQAVLMQNDPADAVAGSNSLFKAFHGLLVSLVGEPLTERLLHGVWTNTLRGPAAQETA